MWHLKFLNFLKISRGGGNTPELPRRQGARAASLAPLVPASGPSPRPWLRVSGSDSYALLFLFIIIYIVRPTYICRIKFVNVHCNAQSYQTNDYRLQTCFSKMFSGLRSQCISRLRLSASKQCSIECANLRTRCRENPRNLLRFVTYNKDRRH